MFGVNSAGRKKPRVVVIRRVVRPKKDGQGQGAALSEAPGSTALPGVDQLSSPETSRGSGADAADAESEKTVGTSDSAFRSDTMTTVPESADEKDSSDLCQPLTPPEYPNDDQYYTGGVSQFREYEESNWKYWDWPPHGWRPSKHHDAYWDTSSYYYRYNHYDWKWPCDQVQDTPFKQTSPQTVRSDSLEEVEHAARVLRATSGQLIEAPGAMPSSHQVVHGAPEAGNVIPPVAEPKVNPSDPAPVTQTVGTPEVAGAKPAPPVAQNANPSAKDAQVAAGTLSQENATDQSKDTLTEEMKMALAKKRLAAHARYMRYFRSVRSTHLSCVLVGIHNTSTIQRKVVDWRSLYLRCQIAARNSCYGQRSNGKQLVQELPQMLVDLKQNKLKKQRETACPRTSAVVSRLETKQLELFFTCIIYVVCEAHR